MSENIAGNGKKSGQIFWRIIRLLVACYIITGVFLAVLAFVVYKMSPSENFVSGAILFAYVLSTFIGGMILGKMMGKRKYLWGIIFGILYFLVVFVVSIIMNPVVGETFRNTVTIFLLCVSGGMLGGMLG